MHHNLSFTLGLGGLGVFGRIAVAVLLLFALKYLDKSNTEYDKGLKMLLVGGAVSVFLFMLIIGMARGAAILPFFAIGW